MKKVHRNTPYIHVESARVITQYKHEQDQYIIRLYAPKCASTAQPGQFVYIQCAPSLRMRRPYSVLNVSVAAGWIEILYQAIGQGSRLLVSRQNDEMLSVMGPIGQGFRAHVEKSKVLLLGGGVGMPPILFLAQYLQIDQSKWDILVLLASERKFPFETLLDDRDIEGFSERATLRNLKDRGIPGRLCSEQGYVGCFNGKINRAADNWLASLSPAELSRVEIFACGPTGMLVAIAKLAKQYHLPCQLCLEEYMACGVGGCAGCVVKTIIDGESQMKRVCVDGPVFEAHELCFDDD